MNTQDFKTYIKNIRKEALEVGYSIKTMDGYQWIWYQFIKWKNENHFVYDEKEYSKFLLDYYNFDVSKYSNKSKSRHQQFMRSKRILDDFDSYKLNMVKRSLPNALYFDYPSNWNIILDGYLNYLKNVRQNSDNSIKIKQDYLIRLLSYFYQNKISDLKQLSKSDITNFINKMIEKGNVSKRRNFYVLKDFLTYLFIENILLENLSFYVPNIRKKEKITYLFKTR